MAMNDEFNPSYRSESFHSFRDEPTHKLGRNLGVFIIFLGGIGALASCFNEHATFWSAIGGLAAWSVITLFVMVTRAVFAMHWLAWDAHRQQEKTILRQQLDPPSRPIPGNSLIP